ncbi:VWA domain-containing protein [Microcoleus sp. A2-C5]|uniref:vWA domain-containing protein n=1 Tax=unclassified Microcoleus TaxID=2642155 RepID=UPI002FD423BF
MSDITGNQEGIMQAEEEEAFLMGQMAQSTGDYFALLGRDEEAKGEYLAAIAAYNQVISSFSNFAEVQNNRPNLLKNIGDLQEKLYGKLSEPKQIGDRIIKRLTDNEYLTTEVGASAPLYASDANDFSSVGVIYSDAKNLLRSFATSPDFMAKMHKAFSNTFYVEKVEEFAKAWANGDFSNFPQIEIRSSVEMNGALGAFTTVSNKIYLSQEFLAQNVENNHAVVSLLLEEIGHYIDSQINISDSPGDEGEIFAAIVQGKELSQAEDVALNAEDDRSTISLERQSGYQQNLLKLQNTGVPDRVDRAVEFMINPEPRCPVVLLLDTSGSMSGEPINALNRGLAIFKETLKQDKIASMRVEVAVITFGDTHLIQDFVTVDQVILPHLVADGATPMGRAIELALNLLENRKRKYRENYIQYYKPWIFLVTDGQPTDSWQNAAWSVRDAEMNNKFSFFAVGMPSANMDILRDISPPNTPPMLLNQDFSSLFSWVSLSLKQVSTSRMGEKVELPPVGWGKVAIS